MERGLLFTMSETLREFIKCVLAEAAVSIEQSAALGHAMLLERRVIVLYRPLDITVDVVGAMRLSDVEDLDGQSLQFVKNVWAEPGFGPLLYDAALSRGWCVAPDRDSVSSAAAAVWDHYDMKRKDVSAVSLPEEQFAHSSRRWLDRGFIANDPDSL